MNTTHRRVASIQRKDSLASLSSSNAHLTSSPASISGHSSVSHLESPYPAQLSKTTSISTKYSLHADPQTWGANLHPQFREPDDILHNPTVRGGKVIDETELTWGRAFSGRGLANLGCLLLLFFALVGMFVLYPAFSFHALRTQTITVSHQLGINATGQVPVMPGSFSLVDSDTPDDARTITSWKDGKQWQLVFSDEFNVDGRTFYPGEDPYWEAVDLHYWETNNLEWYDPAALTTANGSLAVTLSKKETHGLNYQGGMMTTWNKFCFTGGYLETSVQLPGISNVMGLWPAVWSMGNLGRAGYGASLEGMWPYTYDSCDVGTAPNQTINGLPEVATTSGADYNNYELSYLPGQKLSRCTCPGESHPGPVHNDGTYVGRSAPEIDVFEAQVVGDPAYGHVSQSGQWAPFNKGYVWDNSSANMVIFDDSVTSQNTYLGAEFQQSTSGLTLTNSDCYQLASGCFEIYGFEYAPGYDTGYIEWIANGKAAWRVNAGAVGADSATEISARPVPQEPMYILINLGMSENFGTVDTEHLTFPAVMLVDYIRVYQDPDNINIGCDPEDFPTQAYINTYIDAYTNPNFTTWRDDYGQPFPKNKLVDGC